MEKESKLVRRSELARQLGVHGDTVERWAKAGKLGLKRVKLGKLVFIETSGFKPAEEKDPSNSETLLRSEANA